MLSKAKTIIKRVRLMGACLRRYCLPQSVIRGDMKLFSGLKVSSKIVILIICSSVFLLVSSLTGYYQLTKTTNFVDTMYNKELKQIETISDLRKLNSDNQAALLLFILSTKEKQNQFLFEIEENKKKIIELVAQYQSLNLDEFQSNQLTALNGNLQAFDSFQMLVTQVAEGNDTITTFVTFNSGNIIYDGLDSDLLSLANHSSENAEALKDQIQINSDLASKIMISLLISSIILCVIIGWLIITSISRPLNKVVAIANEISNGQLKLEQIETNQSKNEINILNIAMNKMKDYLRTIINEVSSSSDKILVFSQELADASGQIANSTNQIAMTMSNFANGATEQTESSGLIVKMMKETRSQVEIGYQEATATVKEANNSTIVAIEGQEATNRAIEHLNIIAESVAEASELIDDLGNQSNQISEIITLITEISNQTNLLALNAAIEAARAGEAGRGFAVVADEVRKLSEESKEASNKIVNLVDRIQTSSKASMHLMQNNKKSVEEQVSLIKISGGSLGKIVEHVRRTESDALHISKIFDGLNKGSFEVLSLTQSIADLIQESASSSEEIAATTEEQTSIVEYMAESSKDLAKLANNLKENLNKFSVEISNPFVKENVEDPVRMASAMPLATYKNERDVRVEHCHDSNEDVRG
ncbi:methyl-accepting chemotaxis protein [Desulfosporosinus lacus]|uniref:Methyl-accepting chemotaxis protein n=1 Tax=Desulfosporosinus lacus DSM 15449 TaxID=1121420 RepID=A0A1M5ZN23_9FIRM|nr:HAMP domain-containing methyl-accepting chemotaxis protein [Desulfosporosinus lacus]SHI25630.1 methyl-accepting chemotaxis protein [Desulfosporosinus lacus DSM 15449]